jgi:hypothetical protein
VPEGVDVMTSLFDGASVDWVFCCWLLVLTACGTIAADAGMLEGRGTVT